VTSSHHRSNTRWPASGDGSGDDLAATERNGQETPPGSEAPAVQPTVIRYRLRYPPQVPFAASRPGAITRTRDAISRRPTDRPVTERRTP
jgi:hypothetical protein